MLFRSAGATSESGVVLAAGAAVSSRAKFAQRCVSAWGQCSEAE